MAKPWLQRKNNYYRNCKNSINEPNLDAAEDFPNFGFVGFKLYFYDFGL